ncbi:transmembrane protein 116-like isoform X1 [Aptenodytes patagonicus]|uniref:transmembrane protein 116-like isoform X1 n=1 Tax=Aptenodytes patagonicus TaxID=9234 RepID=UPI003F9EFD9E
MGGIPVPACTCWFAAGSQAARRHRGWRRAMLASAPPAPAGSCISCCVLAPQHARGRCKGGCHAFAWAPRSQGADLLPAHRACTQQPACLWGSSCCPGRAGSSGCAAQAEPQPCPHTRGVERAQPAAAVGAAVVQPAGPQVVPGGREELERLPSLSCPAMANEEEHPSALSDNQVFVLTCIYLPASLLSLLGSGSVLAVTSRQRRCCHIQLRPLFLLALADFLAAAVLLSTATIQLLPAPLFIPAYAACPYGLMLATTFYSVSFLMVVVYAYEAYRTVRGWRAWHVAALQEKSGCLENAWQGLPYILAWLVPALTLLGQLIARGTSLTNIAPRPIEPVVPWKGNRSHETYSLYCSSCLLLIHRAQDNCYKYIGRKDVGLEGKIIFFLYLLLVLSCCTLLYGRVKLWCQRNAAAPLLTLGKDGFAGRSIRSVSKVSHYFQLVFLLCWAPAFLLTLLSFTSIKPASVFVLYVATALTVSLQGFLHSLVYGWLRQNFRQEAVGKRSSLQHRWGLKTFYDDSLGAVP